MDGVSFHLSFGRRHNTTSTWPCSATQRRDAEPSAQKINWDCEIFDSPVPKNEESDDVEGVVSIIGEEERVNDGVAVDGEGR